MLRILHIQVQRGKSFKAFVPDMNVILADGNELSAGHNYCQSSIVTNTRRILKCDILGMFKREKEWHSTSGWM